MYKTNNYQTIFLAILLLLLPLGSFAQQASAQQTFTLQQCIDYALQNSVTIKNADLDVQIADYKVKEITASGFPQINGSVNFTNNYRIQRVFLPAQFFDPNAPADAPPVAAEFGVANSGLGSVQLNQLIFDGSFFLGLRAAEVYRELSTKAAASGKIDVTVAVSKAFYGVLVFQERLKLLDINYVRLDTLLQQTKTMYASGFVEKIDVDRLQVSLNNLKIDRDKYLKAIELNKAVLKFQMGMDINTPLEVTGAIDEATLNTLVNSSQAFDYKNRIEYSILETQRNLGELNIKQYQVGYLPKLYGSVTYGWNTSGNKLGEMSKLFGFGSIGLSLQIPIFDSFMKKHQISQAKLSLMKTENTQRNLQIAIDLEQTQAKITLQSSLATLESQRSNVELAKEVYRVAQVKYQEGVGSNIEVLNAESAFKEAETNYYAALFDAYIASVDYKKAFGLLQ